MEIHQMESVMSLPSQSIPGIDGRSIGHAVLCSRCLEIMSSWSDEWQANRLKSEEKWAELGTEGHRG